MTLLLALAIGLVGCLIGLFMIRARRRQEMNKELGESIRRHEMRDRQ